MGGLYINGVGWVKFWWCDCVDGGLLCVREFWSGVELFFFNVVDVG